MKNKDIVTALDDILESMKVLKLKAKINNESNNFNSALEKLEWYRDGVNKNICPHCKENLRGRHANS